MMSSNQSVSVIRCPGSLNRKNLRRHTKCIRSRSYGWPVHRRPHVLLIDEQEESLRLNLASLNHVLTLRDMQRQLERLVGFKGEPDLEKAQELLRQMVMSIVDRYDKATWLFFSDAYRVPRSNSSIAASRRSSPPSGSWRRSQR